MTLYSRTLKASRVHLGVELETHTLCAALARLLKGLTRKGEPQIRGCWAVWPLTQDLSTLGCTSLMGQTLWAAQQAGRQGALGDVFITQQTDVAFLQLSHSPWRDTVEAAQSANRPEMGQQDIATLIRRVGHVAPADTQRDVEAMRKGFLGR